MPHRAIRLGLLGALMAAGLARAEPLAEPARAPLRVMVSSAWAMPLVDLRQQRVQGGLVPDLTQAVARRLGRKVQYVVLPRDQLDAVAQAGNADLRCYVRPAWSGVPEAYAWSGELFSVTNVVVGHAEVPDPEQLERLPPGSAVGATRAFRYPPLEPGFQAGTWRRDDAISQDKLMRKLVLKRHPYAVTDVLTLGWFLRQQPGAPLAPWRLVVSQEAIHCAVPKASPVDAALVLAAVEALRQSGDVPLILNRYR
jgi:ABC-type amino acid transport substrate-binding protein